MLKKEPYITGSFLFAHRARKIKDFKGMMCKAVVVVPADPEFQRRVGARNIEQGQEIPTAAVDQMKANYVLPEYDESFSEVLYTELSPKEAQLLVQQYNANSAMKGRSRVFLPLSWYGQTITVLGVFLCEYGIVRNPNFSLSYSIFWS